MENLNEQDVNTPESSEPVSNEVETQVNTEAQAKPEAPTTTESKYVPYDRFQEMVRDRQEADKRYRALEERYSSLDKELQGLKAPKSQDHPLISEMSKIDPRYGEYLKNLEAKAAKFDTFEQDFNQYRQSQLISQYDNSIHALHEKNKVPEEIRGFIKAQLDVKALRGQINLAQVDSEYKAILDSYNKVFESREREATKKYVQERKKDASLPPSQPKGTAASGKSNVKFNGNREELLASVASSALTKARAAKDL